MKSSADRILTTHIGSFPRPQDLWTMIGAQDRGQPYDQDALAKRIKSAVADIAHKQVEAGIDIPLGRRAKQAQLHQLRQGPSVRLGRDQLSTVPHPARAEQGQADLSGCIHGGDFCNKLRS